MVLSLKKRTNKERQKYEKATDVFRLAGAVRERDECDGAGECGGEV